MAEARQRPEEAVMEARRYRGIAFTPTGKAALLLDSGEWLLLSATQGENLLRGRAEEGLPPIPVIEPPDVLPTRDPLRNRAGVLRHKKIELPPSVIRAPLVLWRSTGAASLTCHRVIAYPDGFEIELCAEGLLIQDAEMPLGRSSRGFWHFGGLQLGVSFADDRSQHIEDLTSGDQEGPVTVSPFRRDDSELETLWLWVMPLPTDGPVRLVATWPLRDIEQAAVEFEVASRQTGETAP